MKTIIGATLAIFFSAMANAAWDYKTETEPMSGKETVTASVASTNSIDMGWPHGKSTGFLIIRRHPRHGKDVIFSVSSGQMLCRSYKPCEILVRFDDKPAQRYSAVGPSDGSSTAMFIQGFDRFVGAAKNAKQVRIEAEFYRRGQNLFTFDVAGLDTSKILVSTKAKPGK